MLDTEFSEKVMDSPVLSQAVKQVLIESMSNLDGDTRAEVCTPVSYTHLADCQAGGRR